MAKATAEDKKILELIEEVKRRKAEIKKAEHPKWLTNCSFAYGKGQERVNLQVVQNLSELAEIAGFLTQKRTHIETGLTLLGAPHQEFRWMNFTYDEWINDLQQRANKIQIERKKQELEVIQNRLDKLISPDMRRKMELEELENLLK